MNQLNKESAFLPTDIIHSDIQAAANDAYLTIAEQGGQNPEEIHRLSVCYRAAVLMVASLVEKGYDAKHEIHESPTVVEHSYVALGMNHEDEIIADPTWQQFLTKDNIDENMPKVLIGTRSDVSGQARHFGVDETTTQLWREESGRMVEDQKRLDEEAKRKADAAVQDGAWERFIAAHDSSSSEAKTGARKLRRTFGLTRRQPHYYQVYFA